MFFGLWLVPLGYLAHTSGWFPKALALSLVVAGGCYVLDLLTAFLVSDFNQIIGSFIVIPYIIAEVWMLGYLLIVGVRTDKTVTSDENVLAAV